MNGSRGAGAPERQRVLHIIQNLNYGGMERLLADLVRGVRSDRFDPHVLVLQYVGRFGEELDGVAEVHQAAPMSRLSMLWPRSLAAEIARIAPAVVHSHSGVWNKAARAARAAGVPRIVHTEHGRPLPDPWQARCLDALASRRTDVVVAVSDALAGTLRSEIVSGNCRVETILNGVDTERFRPGGSGSDTRAELGVAHDSLVIGSIGRLEPIKGYDVMIEAFALLLQRRGDLPAPVLMLAGDGSERRALERRCRELGIADHVRLVGWRDDVESLLTSFDLFAMSSRSEGTSISLLEAMSTGLCPVVTDVGGNRAVLGERLSHRLMPSADPAALSAGLLNALSDKSRRAADATAARERVRRKYSAAAMVAAYERVYAPQDFEQPK